MRTRSSWGLVWLVLLAWGAPPARALEVPIYGGYVSDYVHALEPEQAAQISSMLDAHRKKTGQHFALLIIPGLEGEPLEKFSLRVAEKWKLGEAGKDNGLLMLIVIYDRRMRIEVGYGLEGIYPDVFCNQVIRNILTPRFRNSKYFLGIEQAFQALIRVSERSGDDSEDSAQTILAELERESGGDGKMELEGPLWWGVAIFLFGILSFFSMMVLWIDDEMGWGMYGFMALFWGIFPHFLLSTATSIGVLFVYLVLFGVGRGLLYHTRMGKPWVSRLQKLIPQGSGGGTGSSFGSSGSFRSSSSSSSSFSSSSGGGGRFGGGGSSGSW